MWNPMVQTWGRRADLRVTARGQVLLAQGRSNGGVMSESPSVKTMRLRYDGRCVGCGQPVAAGDRAHYLRATKSVRCLTCGTSGTGPAPAGPAVTSSSESVASVTPTPPMPFVAPTWPSHRSTTAAPTSAALEVVQGQLPRAGRCDDCARPLKRGSEVLHDPAGSTVLCLECVTLDTLHSLGVAGGGARREHAKRLDRHQTRVRTAHPRLGGLILTLAEDPQHVRAWQTGAVGEEEFGRRLSGVASERLKVLHDRKVPRSAANIDHLAVTGEAVWVLDAKRYKGKVETRGHGVFSRRPPELYVNGRNQTKLIEGVQRQVAVVRSVLAPLAEELGVGGIPPVWAGLVFIHAEFGLFTSPFEVDGVWVGWGKAIRKRLVDQPPSRSVDVVAKRLARELRAG